MSEWFDKEYGKEKSNIFKKRKMKKQKLPNKLKDVLLLAGGTILLAEAIDIIN